LCALSSHVSASTPFYTLSLHDALPISVAALERSRIARESAVTGAHGDRSARCLAIVGAREDRNPEPPGELLHLDAFEEIHRPERDRKSTRLNSSHVKISYAVFCLQKKK